MDPLLQTSHFSLQTSLLGIIRLVLNLHLYPQLMDVPYLVVLQPGLVWFFFRPLKLDQGPYIRINKIDEPWAELRTR